MVKVEGVFLKKTKIGDYGRVVVMQTDRRDEIIKYFRALDRAYFMDLYKEYAYEDTPFPIGYGQTISQPSLVLEMTILLDIKQESQVLEIGTGSGYQTALLAKVAQKVFTVERIEELYLRSKERLLKAGYKNIAFKLAEGVLGWPEKAPFDRIMVTAAPQEVPQALLDQLSYHGKMVIPVGATYAQDLLLITKDVKGNIEQRAIAKVSFVPLRNS